MQNINIDLNNILNRNEEVNNFKNILINFENNKHNLSIKKGIYIYGNPGCGKTTFVINLLKELDYDYIKYDAGDVRNKTIIENITKDNISDKNILSLFHKKVKKIAIIMDEIDGMNNGDKGGLNSLIKLMRPKKTKKQKLEDYCLNPIICIGNYFVDKKIKELMKICNNIELKTPNNNQISLLIDKFLPNLNENIKNNLIYYIQGDLRKLNNIINLFKKDNIISENNIDLEIFNSIFITKSFNDDTRIITKKIINENYSIKDHNIIMNETDRTIVGLLFHENIIEIFNKIPKEKSIPLYIKILDNICLADYIDRITFQKQIWRFNEMSSLIKILKNNNLLNEYNNNDNNIKKLKFNSNEIRFTKVLTKYSTEYNNNMFIQFLCQKFSLDKRDLFSFFVFLKNKYQDINIILQLLENYDISKLDVMRIYRFIDKFIKENIDEDENDSDDNINNIFDKEIFDKFDKDYDIDNEEKLENYE